MTATIIIKAQDIAGAAIKAPVRRPKNHMLLPELEENIHKILLQIYPESRAVKKPFMLKRLHPYSGGHDSLVYMVSVNGMDERFILKQHNPKHDREWAKLCAKREYEVLINLAHELPQHSQRTGVPQVVAFFPENHAILMKECPGESFAHMLRWTRIRRVWTEHRLLRGATSCGEWLGVFHRASRQIKVKSAEVQGEIERMFSNDLHSCGRLGLEERILTRAADYFTKRYREVFQGALEYTGHHGDFGPHNIFLSTEGAMAIDFEGFRIGLPGEDLADFLVLLNLLPFYHASASLRSNLRRAFLDGYSRQRPLQIELLSVFELQALVKRMAHNPQLNISADRIVWHKREQLLGFYRKYFESLLQ
jgi:Ser/Thr protein kinase RdoA (MazF antagonist)